MIKRIYEIADEYFNRNGNLDRMHDLLANVDVMATENGQDILGTAKVPLSMLNFPRYQVDRLHFLNEEKIVSLSQNFDLRKAGYIDIIPNRERGSFDVCEGMGRVIAAHMCGRDYVLANVHLGVSDDEIERYGAELFRGQYDEVRPMKAVHQHTASLVLNDPVVSVVDRLANKYGILISPTSKERREGKVYLKSYLDALEIVKVNGAKGLDFAFKVIHHAGWDMETFGYSTYSMRMMRYIYQAYGEERKIINVFSSILRESSPTAFKERARDAYPKRNYRVACVLYADDLLKQRFGSRNRFAYVDNKISIVA